MTQGDQQPNEQTIPSTSKQPKRKSSVTKTQRGGKKTQKTSPSHWPPQLKCYSNGEQVSSPDEDGFVTSRRTSAASVLPTGSEDAAATPQITYPENQDQPSPQLPTPQADTQVKTAPQEAGDCLPALSHNQPHLHMGPFGAKPAQLPRHHYIPHSHAVPHPYLYGGRVRVFSMRPQFFQSMGGPGLGTSLSPPNDMGGLVNLAPPGAYAMGPLQFQGPILPSHVVPASTQARGSLPPSQAVPATTQAQPVQADGYEMPVAGHQEVTVQESTPLFERIDDITGARMRITAPPNTGYRHNGPETRVFELYTSAAPENKNPWAQPAASVPSSQGMCSSIYPGPYVG